MFKNCKYSIAFLNTDNLLIFKFRKCKFDLNDNFINNWQNSNARRFLNSYALKWYEARRPKNHLGGQILYRSPDPGKKWHIKCSKNLDMSTSDTVDVIDSGVTRLSASSPINDDSESDQPADERTPLVRNYATPRELIESCSLSSRSWRNTSSYLARISYYSRLNNNGHANFNVPPHISAQYLVIPTASGKEYIFGIQVCFVNFFRIFFCTFLNVLWTCFELCFCEPFVIFLIFFLNFFLFFFWTFFLNFFCCFFVNFFLNFFVYFFGSWTFLITLCTACL